MNYITPVTNADLGDAVRSTALLADLTISTWGAEKTDRKVTDKVKEDANAVGNVGRMIKNLLAGADTQLKVTRNAFTQARTRHYALTLPWVANPHAERMTGPRLLPNLLFERYVSEMGACKREADKQLDVLIDQYPDLVRQAQANLAGLADASDYPSASQVRGSFALSFDFAPIPSGHEFRGLPEHFIDKLAAGLAKKQERMLATAQRDMWERARERVTHIVARLSQPDAIVHTTTIDNVRDLVDLLPAWDVAGSENTAEIVADIKSMLDGVTVKDIRNDARVRSDVSTQAQRVLEKFNQWGL